MSRNAGYASDQREQAHTLLPKGFAGLNPAPAIPSRKRFAYRNGQMTEITPEPKTVARWPMINAGSNWNG